MDSLPCSGFVTSSGNDDNDPDRNDNTGKELVNVSTHYVESARPFDSPGEIWEFVRETRKRNNEMDTLHVKVKSAEEKANKLEEMVKSGEDKAKKLEEMVKCRDAQIEKLKKQTKKTKNDCSKFKNAMDWLWRIVKSLCRRNGREEELKQLFNGDLSPDETNQRAIELIDSLPEAEQETLEQEVIARVPEAKKSNWKYVLWGVLFGAAAVGLIVGTAGAGAVAIAAGTAAGGVAGGLAGHCYGKYHEKKEA